MNVVYSAFCLTYLELDLKIGAVILTNDRDSIKAWLQLNQTVINKDLHKKY